MQAKNLSMHRFACTLASTPVAKAKAKAKPKHSLIDPAFEECKYMHLPLACQFQIPTEKHLPDKNVS